MQVYRARRDRLAAKSGQQSSSAELAARRTVAATLPTGADGQGRWSEFEGSASGGGLSDSPGQAVESSIVAGASGQFVAWSDSRSGQYEIYVAEHTASGWQQLAGSVQGEASATRPVQPAGRASLSTPTASRWLPIRLTAALQVTSMWPSTIQRPTPARAAGWHWEYRWPRRHQRHGHGGRRRNRGNRRRTGRRLAGSLKRSSECLRQAIHRRGVDAAGHGRRERHGNIRFGQRDQQSGPRNQRRQGRPGLDAIRQ